MEGHHDAAVPPKNFKQQRIVIRGCLFEHIKKIKNKKKFFRMHMEKLWLINSREYDKDSITGIWPFLTDYI